MIRGEYWIDSSGNVQYADGDVGDFNHEGIAANSVAGTHLDNVIDYAKELGVDTKKYRMYEEENPAYVAKELLYKIENILLEDENLNFNQDQARQEIMNKLDIDYEVLAILQDYGDARLYVMKNDGYIAVRGENVELFGFNQQKAKNLLDGLNEILDIEGIEDTDLNLSIYDHNTKRWSNLSYEELEQGNLFKPKLPLQAPSHQILPPMKGKQFGREYWRGTSEQVLDFRSFMR